jgi:hypothetical protein
MSFLFFVPQLCAMNRGCVQVLSEIMAVLERDEKFRYAHKLDQPRSLTATLLPSLCRRAKKLLNQDTLVVVDPLFPTKKKKLEDPQEQRLTLVPTPCSQNHKFFVMTYARNLVL